MRFLADMCMSLLTGVWLREQGHDAVHLEELGLRQLADPEIIAMSRVEDRILLTMDLDFGYLLAVSEANLPSVILFRLSDQRSEIVNQRLAEVLANYGGRLEKGVIVSVTDHAARLRKLPIQRRGTRDSL